jgi:hypothetical protein
MIEIKTDQKTGFIPKTITKDQSKDTGMAMVLICLLIGIIGEKQQFYAIAILLHLINMIWPNIYRPVAKLWLGLSQLLGTVMSKVILSILFYLMVTPVGFIRKLFGADSMQIKKWRKDSGSVFKKRDHKFKPEDIKHPY